MAAKAKPVDPDQVKKLAAMGCTDTQIASFFDMKRETFSRKKAKSKAIQEAIELGRLKGDTSLIKAQYDKALQGNPTMLIWLGKQRLGQKDRVEHSDGGIVLLADRLAAARARLAKHREAEAAANTPPPRPQGS